MKVGINHTLEVSDQQRVELADVLDQKVSKRMATRDEFKAYIWAHGADWSFSLSEAHQILVPVEPSEDDIDLDDLLGEPDLEDLL